MDGHEDVEEKAKHLEERNANHVDDTVLHSPGDIRRKWYLEIG